MIRERSAKAEILMIVLLASVPLFMSLPYRVNIFLSWEGAYRMSQGQLPFRDFGIPLGGMYWVVPAIFFKLFGSAMVTLIKAQVFLNIVAGLSFRSILKSLSVDKGIRLASVLLFCISYSFFNFWPWYNHTVIVYELVALACICRWIRIEVDRTVLFAGESGKAGKESGNVVNESTKAGKESTRSGLGWLVAGGLFTVFSFLTKQDGGGLCFMLGCLLLAAYGFLQRSWKPLLLFVGSFLLLLLLVLLPFLSHGFGYWFNHGQPPHTARVSLWDIAEEFFAESQWIKLYIFLIGVLGIIRWRSREAILADKKGFILMVLALGILGEAAILQVTSYTPPDNNIFFHSFGFAAVFSLLGALLPAGFRFSNRPLMLSLLAGIVLWWSSIWWKYTQRVAGKILPHHEVAQSPTGENVVNKSTYMINRDTVKDIPMDQWVECGLPSFRKIVMPAPTAEGIHRLMDMDLIRRYREQRASGAGMGTAAGLKVLNMSELTPLAADIPFELERNPRLPLWYHLGVGMFNRQADSFSVRIQQHYYDLILFEYIPTLNNFYPFRLRDSLHQYYRQVDSFLAPRRGPETKGQIEVFVRQEDSVHRSL